MKKIEIPTSDELNAMYKKTGISRGFSEWYRGVVAAIAYANTQLEAAEPVEPWRPVEGMKCAFWDKDDEYTKAGTFARYITEGSWPWEMFFGDVWNHCAALDNLDEIGKPPSYFIERDNRHT